MFAIVLSKKDFYPQFQKWCRTFLDGGINKLCDFSLHGFSV